ncbi:MAG: hypothetical protein ACK59X_21595 [Acidovorax sp.]
MKFASPFKKISATTTLAVASLGAASPVWADITASATSSGSARAYTLVTRITPDAQYVGRGKLYFVMLHGSQIYVLSETRGFLPYTGGEPVEYRTITQASETITVQGWNTTAQAGASIFVGYGSDVMDMLNNGRFKLVATLPAAPAPPPNIQYAAYSGTYMCFDDHGRSGSVTATFTASRAVVDTTQLSAIPDYSYDLPINNLAYEPDMLLYRTQTYPVRAVGLSLVRTSSPYTMVVGYQASRSSTEIVYGCTKQ